MPTWTAAQIPYELGLGRLVDLDMDADFVGKARPKTDCRGTAFSASK